jgi:pimeloyl-ACP methyl ester carboxylesterase
MAAASPTSRHLELDGLKYHYLDWDGDGPPLVMLHGLTGHAHTWDHTAARGAARRGRLLARRGRAQLEPEPSTHRH